jgi:hypothetical protein
VSLPNLAPPVEQDARDVVHRDTDDRDPAADQPQDLTG